MWEAKSLSCFHVQADVEVPGLRALRADAERVEHLDVAAVSLALGQEQPRLPGHAATQEAVEQGRASGSLPYSSAGELKP